MKPRVARNELLWVADHARKNPARGFGNPHAHTQLASLATQATSRLPAETFAAIPPFAGIVMKSDE
jgi:hypothetical protein